MPDFGFKAHKDRQIDFDKGDFRLLNFLNKKEPTFRLCIMCGTCSATCTAGAISDFNIRKLTTLIRRGYIDEVKAEINKCVLCGKCQMACPRGINTRNTIIQISNYLSETNV